MSILNLPAEQPLLKQPLPLDSDPIATDESLLATINGFTASFSQPMGPGNEDSWGYNNLYPTLPDSRANNLDSCIPSVGGASTGNIPQPHNGKKSDASLRANNQFPLDGAPSNKLSPPKRKSHRASNGGHNNRRKSTGESSSPSDEQPGEKTRRQRLLERNRVAANKCRQKKKEETKDLESRCQELSSRKDCLMAHFAQLQMEALDLKNAVLKHADCGDESIERHLAQSAMSLTNSCTLSEPAVVPGVTSSPDAAVSPVAISADSYPRTAESFESPPFQNSWVSQAPMPGRF